MDQYGLVKFEDSFIDGFDFDDDNRLVWPDTYAELVGDEQEVAKGRRNAIPIVTEALHSSHPLVHPRNPYQPEGMYTPMSSSVMEDCSKYFKQDSMWSVRSRNGASGNGVATDASSSETAEAAVQR